MNDGPSWFDEVGFWVSLVISLVAVYLHGCVT